MLKDVAKVTGARSESILLSPEPALYSSMIILNVHLGYRYIKNKFTRYICEHVCITLTFFCYRETLARDTDNWHSCLHLGNINQGIILIESSPLP